MRIADETLFQDFERLRPAHTSDAATHRAMLLRYESEGVTLSRHTLRRRLNLYRKLVAQREGERPAPIEVPPALPVFYILPRTATAPAPDDSERWADTLATLRIQHPYTMVAHLCDIHFPRHSEAALNMAYRLIAKKQPQIIVVGSDTADFTLISKFAPDPDANEDIADELDELRRYWTPHIDTLKRIAPNAALVYIMGNHESRIYRHVEENAPKLRRTIERAWVELVSQRGSVMWLGRREQVDIGHLVVQHGYRHNEHVAKSLLADLSYQASSMAGHVHRLNRCDVAGYKYPVASVTSGCLCDLQPHYLHGRRNPRPWQWGTAFGVVNLRGTDAFIENVEFRAIDVQLVAVTDGVVTEMPLTAVDKAA